MDPLRWGISKHFSQSFSTFENNFFRFIHKIVEKGCHSVSSSNVIAIVSWSMDVLHMPECCHQLCSLQHLFFTCWVRPLCFCLLDGQTGRIFFDPPSTGGNPWTLNFFYFSFSWFFSPFIVSVAQLILCYS
jgi:hypothetical protein